MNQNIPYWQVGGFLFASILGTFLHFLFDLTGGSAVAAVFSAVNESIWEHMKLLYYPMVLYAVAEYFFWGRENQNFWCIKGKGIGLGLGLIPVIYYTYTGILGVSADWFNITIFFLTAGFAFWWETKQFPRDSPCAISGKTAIVFIFLIGIVFTVLTFRPFRIPFFEDPVTGTYGFQNP